MSPDIDVHWGEPLVIESYNLSWAIFWLKKYRSRIIGSTRTNFLVFWILIIYLYGLVYVLCWWGLFDHLIDLCCWVIKIWSSEVTWLSNFMRYAFEVRLIGQAIIWKQNVLQMQSIRYWCSIVLFMTLHMITSMLIYPWANIATPKKIGWQASLERCLSNSLLYV